VNTAAPIDFGPPQEYTPPDFQPVSVSPWLQVTRSLLFGAQPDQFMLAYRACRLLAVVDLAPLTEYTRTFDPRRTDEP
jgi:hypothetical protein